ncbi:MAG: hypothetical protein IPN51_03915 [Chloracidobacterium sp.]|nr:hypothetical protein [Chloracidobacterium sp.]
MCKYVKNVGIVIVFILVTGFITSAQSTVPPTDVGSARPMPSATPTDDAMRNRVKLLEEQVEMMRRELAELRSAVGKNSNSGADTSAKAEPKPAVGQKVEAVAAVPAKKDLGMDVGSARLTPYGILFFNAFGNSGGTNNSDIPLFATTSGTGNVSASVRQTRLGIRLEGAKVGKARLSAIFEGDFFGGFPSVAIGENFGVFRLRLANARLDWEKTSMTIGQDWMVFAPASPTSLAAAGIPQMAASGNLWSRLPQVKVERKLTPHVTLQAALLAPQTGDFATNAAFFLQPTSGTASRVPYLQSRIAFSGKNWFQSKKAGSIGISGHYGRSAVFTGANNVRNDLDSVGLALDWNLPFSKRLSLTGEAFVGRNLGGFQGGVFQGYNTDFAYRQGVASTAGGVRAIGTRGGWAQIGFTPKVLKDRLGIYGTVGIDDPKNSDLTSIASRDWRLRNMSVAGEMIYKFTPQFSFGIEYRGFWTTYMLRGQQHANHVNLAASYSF